MRAEARDFIAIPTCERAHELLACVACLRGAAGLDGFRIFVRDDASTSFDAAAIRALLPEAEKIDRNAQRLGSSGNHMRLLGDCLDAGARRILVLDSDLIVSPAILDFARAAFSRTDGVLGLYNSVHHRETGDIDAELVRKETIGGAASFWDAELLRRVVSTYKGGPPTWDWHAVAVLKDMKRRIAVSRRSYAQHLGLHGEHNRVFGRIEYGRGFIIETDVQARFMAAAFDTMMTRQEAFLPG